MEYIQINCNECNYVNFLYITLRIDFNYDVIKNIIDSNYKTYIYYCNHKINDVMNITNKTHHHCMNFEQLTIITNKNYLKIYNEFTVCTHNETQIILLNNGIDKIKSVSLEEFMSRIKKGFLIKCNPLKIQKLEKILLEHNFDFILKNIGYCEFIVDTSNYTKPATKQK